MTTVSITGLGLLSSVAHNVSAFNDAIKNKRTGIKEFPFEDYPGTLISKKENYNVGHIKGFSLDQYFDKKDINSIDRSTLYILKAIDEAIIDSNIHKKNIRVGVLMGSAVGIFPPYTRLRKLLRAYKGDIASLPQLQHYQSYFMELLTNTPIDIVCKKYGFKNYSSGLTGICSSGALTVSYGHQLIKSGRVDAIVCCGFDFFYSPMNKTFSQYNLLSKKTCKPFDRLRDGFQLGEGVGVIVLENKKHTDDSAYADCIGTGLSNDAYHMVMPSPSGDAYANAITQSLDESGLDAIDIDYISPIGRGGIYSDLKEARGIKKALGKHASLIPVNSVIPNVGYSLGASSSFNIIYALMQMKENRIYPTLNTNNIDIKLGLNIIKDTTIEKKLANVLVTSFAFAGVNTSLVFQKSEVSNE